MPSGTACVAHDVALRSHRRPSCHQGYCGNRNQMAKNTLSALAQMKIKASNCRLGKGGSVQNAHAQHAGNSGLDTQNRGREEGWDGGEVQRREKP